MGLPLNRANNIAITHHYIPLTSAWDNLQGKTNNNMLLKKQLTTREQGRRLHELGIDRGLAFFRHFGANDISISKGEKHGCVSAFSMAELGRMIYVEFKTKTEEQDKQLRRIMDTNHFNSIDFWFESLAFGLSEKLLDPDKCNEALAAD